MSDFKFRVKIDEFFNPALGWTKIEQPIDDAVGIDFWATPSPPATMHFSKGWYVFSWGGKWKGYVDLNTKRKARLAHLEKKRRRARSGK